MPKIDVKHSNDHWHTIYRNGKQYRVIHDITEV